MASTNNNNNSRKKLDEYHTKVLRELGALPCNKNCFDCNQRGPTYVDVTIGSFVCTKCSGILRGLTPPHRVKSISMTTFTPEEVEMLKSRGNDYCRKVWLGLCDNSIQYKDEQQIKDFMIDKYEKKRYYIDPSTIPNLKSSSTMSTSHPSLSSPPQPHPHPQSIHHLPKSTLRTTQITLTNGSGPSPTSSTSSTRTNNTSTPASFQPDFKLAPKDPFSSSSKNSQHPQQQQQPSFANFDNAVFSSVQQAPPCTQMRTSASCHLDMFSDLLLSSYKPALHNTCSVSSNLNRWSIAGVPELNKKPMTAPLEIPKEDRYAALKDLDSIMKQQSLGSTPTALDNQTLNSDMSSSSNGWSSNGLFGSPSASHMFPPSNGSSLFGGSPQMNGGSAFSTPNGGAFSNGSMFSSNGSAFGSPSTNGSLFGSPGGRSTESPIILNGDLSSKPAAAFNNANPFRTNGTSDMGWPSQTLSSNGPIMNGGFPLSQSLDFSAAKNQWPMVNHHIANPFKMNTAAPQTTAPHHSSNPFL
uniref:Arf-GAP domain and FG repeat-containing protein 1 n=2 Tax=Cacopsylla melanoneura TaxID=428564 RepID=A0A8D8V2B9_9HEMI